MIAKIAALLLVTASAAAVAAPRDYIETPSGQRLGYLEQSSSRITAYSAAGRPLGYYDRNADVTRNNAGQIVVRGNAVVAFIVDLK